MIRVGGVTPQDGGPSWVGGASSGESEMRGRRPAGSVRYAVKCGAQRIVSVHPG